MTRQKTRALLVRDVLRRRRATPERQLAHLRTIRSAVPLNHPTIR